MDKLLKIINELKENPLIKENENYTEELVSIQKRLEDKNFKLAVVGEFSSGKSTFINALIGKDLLKHATIETTATVTYIHNKDSKHKTKIKVNYINGEIKEYLDYQYIKDATTTTSQEDVAKDIDFVDIYIPFVNTQSDLIIVDTPGLNGTADHHREKTIEEIKESHICIYLLQKNGITDSDREFIRFLFSYQNNFIFIQNFIDELKESEGETLSKKLDFLKSDIEKIIEKENVNIDYRIVGISGLKGLVGKDKTISKLYENDIFELTDEMREKYLQESNIPKVENIIKEFNQKKNNPKSRINLTVHTLLIFLQKVINKEDNIIRRNKELIKDDEYFKHKQLVEKDIWKLKKQEGIIIEKLKNSVDSQFIKYKRLLNKKIEDRLKQIESEINQIISNETSYEQFNHKCKTGYFVNELQKRIDCYKKNIEDDENYITQHIYKSMLTRLTEYRRCPSKNIDNLDKIELGGIKKEDLTFNKERKEIEKLKDELYNHQHIIENLEYRMPGILENIEKINSKYDSAQSKKEKLKEKKINEQKKLGVRPEGYTEYDEREVEVERSGLLKPIDWLFGPKTQKISVPRYNDKKGIEWDAKQRYLEMEYQRELDLINKELDDLINQQNKLNSQIDIDNMNFEKSNRMIKYIEHQIRMKTEELLQYEKNAKKEYLVKRKKEIREGINNYLYNTNRKNKSVEELFREKVDVDFRNNKKKIKEMIEKEVREHIENEVKRFEAIKNNSVDELNKKYGDDEKYLNQIIEIFKKLGGDKYESIQTRV